MQIHPTAIVHPKAQLQNDVVVGPYAFIGPHVILGKHCVVEHHATIDGHTEMGQNNCIYPYCYLGAKTHDLKHKGGICHLKIGDDNVFREYVSIHTSTQDGQATTLGSHNYILAFAHIGHDCTVKDYVIISAQVAMGGHVSIGNYANIGGNTSLHQFCRVGDYAMLGGHSFLKKDIPPFMLACGVPAVAKTFNRIGMLRNGFSEQECAVVKKIFKYMYGSNLNRSQAMETIANDSVIAQCPIIAKLILHFVHTPSTRGLV
ncbi:MAG: acyl-ACP--UDP-N-acetylglucosamine O-acyltransferase [Puniceicoccales bacterium]|jgi:UDP-N-acetylglucosamine acyltransferase|nr:acyl-ACP--UDP-N-acetylglucosamine O-acyltransferase [Puniceicoccales bacterium]